MKKYDAIIIGAGQAGFPLAGALAERGWQVALAESNLIGGTCINSGCSPTKTIVASARVAHMARRAADFGIQIGEVDIDFARIMERKDEIVNRFRGGVENWLNGLEKLTIYHHVAMFESSHRVRVGNDIIEADHIFINTGARSFSPPIPGLDGINYLDNVSILDLKTLPEHLVVIGGGYIGLEYAQAFRRFGSKITIIELSHQIMGREDPDIAHTALSIMENEGIRVLLNAKTSQVDKHEHGVMITVEHGDCREEIIASHLLMAVGRKPNSDRLGLEKAGIETDSHGYIVVNDHLETNVQGIWAMGDVNGRGAFTHTSWNDYEIVLDNLEGGRRSITGRIPAYGVYIDPPLGRVGMNEQDARNSGRNVLIATKPMSHISRAIERDETQGLMKVIVDADTGFLLGASIFGIGGDEIVHSIIDLMYARVPYTVMKNAVYIHPTVSELLPTLLAELQPL